MPDALHVRFECFQAAPACGLIGRRLAEATEASAHLDANCRVPRGPDRAWPALEVEGTYRTPTAGVHADVMRAGYGEQAAFYRAALLLGLLRGEQVIAWADDVLGGESDAAGAFVEIATTSPEDLTLLRQRLLALCGEKESAEVVAALLGLVHRDLASSRRSFRDTMTVLKQLRAFVTLDASLNDGLKTLGVDVALAAPGSADYVEATQRVRDFLKSYARAADFFL